MASPRHVSVMIDLSQAYVHHHHIYAGIQRYAHETGGWECSLAPFPGASHAARPPRAGVDGIIARADRRLASAARRAGIPLVNVWLNSPVQGLPSVLFDAKEGGRMAAEHLLSRGFRRFGYMGYSRDRGARLQFEGFCEALGSDCSQLWIERSVVNMVSPRKWPRFQSLMDRWIETWSPPIGIFASHDELSRYLAEACRWHHLKVPWDVALIGAFNEPVLTVNRFLSLSSIDYGFERIGYRAAELLDSLMDGNEPPGQPIILPPTDLLARQSSDAFAVENPTLAKALRFIAEMAHTGIGVEEVAAHVQTTPRTLARLFRKCAENSVYATIARMQVERAKRLLIGSDSSVKSIARACGFRDANHICSVFQRLEGMSPRRFRARRSDAGARTRDGEP